jgi:hypothetical protein
MPKPTDNMTTESKGNMYPGVVTWNPLAGKCLHECSYCSTNALKRYPVIQSKYSGEIRLDYKALSKNLGKGKTIFVVAQNDLFAEGVPDSYIEEILNYCGRFDNTYLFQSKNPDRFINWIQWFPEKTILCTTIESNRQYLQMGNSPHPFDRAHAMGSITTFKKQVTIEPIMDFNLHLLVSLIKMAAPNSVNIGADSKHNGLSEPSKENLLALIDELKKFTVIDQKRNLNRLLT